jgi:hypothetical protein
MDAVILHPEQDAEARQKLAALEKKTDKNPTYLSSCWTTWAGGIRVSTAGARP